jgi:hypothetical protein
MLATSQDGLTFQRTGVVLSDQAGVPNVVVDTAGRPRVYYCDFGNGNTLAMAVRLTPTRWAYHRVTVNGIPTRSQGRPGAGFPRGPAGPRITDPVDPTVVRLADGRYRLFFMQGRPLPSFYSALSTDGVHFTAEPGTRFTAAPQPVFDPMVLQTPDGWWLWGGPDGQYAARSKDGLAFEYTGPFRLKSGDGFMPWSAVALPQKKGYRVFGNPMTRIAGIASAVSKDGKHWELEPGWRLSGPGGDPRLEQGLMPDNGVAQLPDGTWLMAYLTRIPGS